VKEYIIGADLGRDTDPTAILIGKLIQTPTSMTKARTGGLYHEDAIERRLSIVYSEQIPLRTPYTEIARRLVDLAKHKQFIGNNQMIMDATGVGTPVVDIIRESKVIPWGVKITAGEYETTRQDGFVNVPKVKLVDSVIALLHTGRLSFANGLEHAELIQKQLAEFEMKRKANGSVKYENRLDVIHDDMVIALGLICWYFVKLYGASLTYVPAGGKITRTIISDPMKIREESWRKRQGRMLENGRQYRR